MVAFLIMTAFFAALFSPLGRELLGILFTGFLIWACMVVALLGVLYVYVLAPMFESLMTML